MLAVCKILLESRAFRQDELKILIDKLLVQVSSSERKMVENIIRDESFHYVPLLHGKSLFEPIWEISQYINAHEIISFTYTRRDGLSREHIVKPVSVMFSEFYFYLISYMADGNKKYPTVFRIDRMEKIKGTGEKFKVPYRDKFSDGEFRKRVQFIYTGELKKFTFKYCGPSIESVLDRIPTAEVLENRDGIYIVQAEVYGEGIEMWLKSQGDMVTDIERNSIE